MKDRINDGGAAFPVIPPLDPEGIGSAADYPYADQGMTLRDWFAGQALAGLCANSIPGGHHRPEKRAAGHWRYDAAKLRIAAERVVIARYFRRFGGRLWQRAAA